MSGRRFRRTPGGVCSLGLPGRAVAGFCAGPRALEQVAADRGWQIVATEVMPDHAHLFVRVGRTDAPRRWCGCSRADGTRPAAGVPAPAPVREGVVVAVVFRRRGRLRLESTVRRYIEHQWGAVMAS